MSDKSYVSLEQHICPICGKTFDTNSLIMDKRLRDTFAKYTITDTEICEECNKLTDEYIAFIVVEDYDQNIVEQKDIFNVNRTGEILWVRREVLKEDMKEYPFVFCEPELAEQFKEMVTPNNKESAD